MQRYKNYVVFRTNNGFVVVNVNKPFKSGHTHVQRFDIAMILCKLAYRKQLPRSKIKYFIESLIRISNDKDYIRELLSFI